MSGRRFRRERKFVENRRRRTDCQGAEEALEARRAKSSNGPEGDWQRGALDQGLLNRTPTRDLSRVPRAPKCACSSGDGDPGCSSTIKR